MICYRLEQYLELENESGDISMYFECIYGVVIFHVDSSDKTFELTMYPDVIFDLKNSKYNLCNFIGILII